MKNLFVLAEPGTSSPTSSSSGRACGPSAPAAAPSGLSRLHKCPLGIVVPLGDFLITSAEGGGVAWVAESLPARPAPKVKQARGQICGFSRASRLRMIENLQTIDRRQVQGVYFDTLTTRRGTLGWKGLEKERRDFLKRFARRWGRDGWFIVWKKEPHESGWPHLHLLIFWLVEPPRLRDFRHWQDEAWASTVAGDDAELRAAVKKAGCKCVRMKSWNGVASYAAKYCTKEVEELAVETGRIWGIANRRLVPVTLRSEQVSRAAGVRVRRCLRKLQERRREQWFVLAEGEWSRIRPRRDYDDDRRLVSFYSVATQVARYQDLGVRVKRKRPSVLGKLVVPLWSRDEDSGKMERNGEEFQSVCSSRHFVSAETVTKLVGWAKARAADVLDCPF